MTQTSTLLTEAAAVPGLPVDGGFFDDISVKMTEAANYGLAVAHDGTADPQSAKLPASAADVALFLGILKNPTAKEPGAAQDDEQASARRKGRIWVTVEDAVSKGDNVFVRYATGAGGSQKGAFRSDADTSTAAQLTGAQFFTDAGAGELVQVELG